jgi:hypothetical protein
MGFLVSTFGLSASYTKGAVSSNKADLSITDGRFQARVYETAESRESFSDLELMRRFTLIFLLNYLGTAGKYFERKVCAETHRTVASHSSHSPILS